MEQTRSSATAELVELNNKITAMTPFTKVADFRTNRKPVCDFLLVSNTYVVSRSRVVAQFLQSVGQISNVLYWANSYTHDCTNFAIKERNYTDNSVNVSITV